MSRITPSPKLTKSTVLAKAQALNARLQALVPTLTTVLSPSALYLPGAPATALGTGSPGPGNLLSQYGKSSSHSANQAGAWTAPDVNGDGSSYTIAAECFGGGGGGGGGSTTVGAGGGGAGEYAAEQSYLISPNKSYVWLTGIGGTPGAANTNAVPSGSAGSPTIFDLAGVNLPYGVTANGGTGGDNGSPGKAGPGGSGSSNSKHYNGGSGALNQSGVGSDNPVTLAATPSYWTVTPPSGRAANAWYVMDDNTAGTAKISDASGQSEDAIVTNYAGGLGTGITSPAAPAQSPTQTAGAGAAGPGGYAVTNPSIAGACMYFQPGSGQAARIQSSPNFSGQYMTLSGRVQCTPSAVWGSTTANSNAMIMTNCGSGNAPGYAVYWQNNGTSSAPNWYLIFRVSNGSAHASAQWAQGIPTPGQWVSFVCTFNNGTLTLYVNGTSVASSTAGFTSVPGGNYPTTFGVGPYNTAEWFYGYTSNFWLSVGVLNSSGVSEAAGVSPATGGAGGGASGSPGGAGGAGVVPAGSAGGAGGTAVAVPSNQSGVLTPGSNGVSGAASHAGAFSSSPAYGAGGGGAGSSSSVFSYGTVTFPFTAAASYCGPDAGNTPGQLYNPGQQGTQSVLFTGGAASDIATGTKNSVILLPPGIKTAVATAAGGSMTPLQLLLTFYNASSLNVPTILEIGFSYDSSLPFTYTGASLVEHVGYLLVPAGANWVTIDLTQSDLFQQLLVGGTVPTALILGPGSSPTFEAYNTTTAGTFYAQVYGPGATDAAGNSLQPYLTVAYSAHSSAPLRGSYGGAGQVNLTLVNNAATLVASAAAVAGTGYTAGFGAYSGTPYRMPTGAVSESAAASLLTNTQTAMASIYLQTTMAGPASSFDGLNAGVNLASATASGSVPAQGSLTAAGGVQLVWDASGVVVPGSLGVSGAFSAAQVLVNGAIGSAQVAVTGTAHFTSTGEFDGGLGIGGATTGAPFWVDGSGNLEIGNGKFTVNATTGGVSASGGNFIVASNGQITGQYGIHTVQLGEFDGGLAVGGSTTSAPFFVSNLGALEIGNGNLTIAVNGQVTGQQGAHFAQALEADGGVGVGGVTTSAPFFVDTSGNLEIGNGKFSVNVGTGGVTASNGNLIVASNGQITGQSGAHVAGFGEFDGGLGVGGTTSSAPFFVSSGGQIDSQSGAHAAGFGEFDGGLGVGGTTSSAPFFVSSGGQIDSQSGAHAAGLGEFDGGIVAPSIAAVVGSGTGFALTLSYGSTGSTIASVDFQGFHVASTLWGTGGILTIGDRVTFSGGATSIHCTAGGEFDGGIGVGGFTSSAPFFVAPVSGQISGQSGIHVTGVGEFGGGIKIGGSLTPVSIAGTWPTTTAAIITGGTNMVNGSTLVSALNDLYNAGHAIGLW